MYERNWSQEKLDYINFLKESIFWPDKREYERLIKDYQLANISYKRFVDKEDFISKSKIEGLINLFTHMTYLDDASQINTEPYINASYLDISLSNERKKVKK